MVGQRNVQVIHGIHRDFGQGNIPGLLKALSPNVGWEFHGPKDVPFAGTHRGHDQMARFFKAIAESVDIIEFRPSGEFLECGDHVVVLGDERVRAKKTGRTWETDWVHIWALRDGLVTLDEFYDTAAIVAAFSGCVGGHPVPVVTASSGSAPRSLRAAQATGRV